MSSNADPAVSRVRPGACPYRLTRKSVNEAGCLKTDCLAFIVRAGRRRPRPFCTAIRNYLDTRIGVACLEQHGVVNRAESMPGEEMVLIARDDLVQAAKGLEEDWPILAGRLKAAL